MLLAAQVAFAQPGTAPPPDLASLRGDSTQTRKRLAEAEQKLIAGKAADAADDLQRLLDESGDDLVTLDGKQYRPARWVAHSLFARLPADVLKAYQDRIDQPAKKLLDQAKRDRDPRPLWQLLDRYFVSRPADEGLLLLGDLLFERGEFRTAENTWRRLLPHAEAGGDLVYPGSKADPAIVRARVALAVIFQNDLNRSKAEVAAFKQKYPAATGTLAGKTGPLAQTLEAFLAAPPKLPPDPTGGNAWVTYGGAPDRAGRVPSGIPNAWPSRPTWKTALPEPPVPRVGAMLPPVRPPFGHPIIMGDEVFVSDGLRVFGFDMRTGEETRAYRPVLNLPQNARLHDPSFTLTAANGVLYARMGACSVRPPEARNGTLAKESVLACLSTTVAGRLRELWTIPPPEDDKTPAAWEGAPLVSGRRLWAVYAKFEGGRIIHTAVCYDPADTDKAPGRPAWTAELCDSPQPVAGTMTARQELLTLAGRHLVFCSNSGAVIAVDALTGKRSWGFRYPRSRKAVNSATSDPAPAVAFGGRVFIAPADGDRVYALDAETGREVWKSEGQTEGARILGVSRNRIIITVVEPVRGIRGLNLDTGSHRNTDGGWAQHNGPDLFSYGQGLVTDDVIVWPSRVGLYFIRPEDGLPYRGTPNPLPSPLKNCFGNLAYADGAIVVATPTQLWCFKAQSRKIEMHPDMPPRERFDALIDRAERELAANHPERAMTAFTEVAGSDLPAPFRAWTAARMLQITPQVTEFSQLPVEVRNAMRAPLLNEWILTQDGIPITLEAFLHRQLGRRPHPGSLPIVNTDERKLCLPGLPAEAAIDRTLKLPHAVSPLLPIAGMSCPPKRLFAAGPQAIITIPLDQSAEKIHTSADLFTHAADLPDGFLAAGPFAVALYSADRDAVWVFRMPITERMPNGSPAFRFRCDREPSRPQFSSFVLAGPWLLARVGEYHLIALDLQAKRVAWVLCATGRSGYEPTQFPGTAKFGPHFAVSGKFVVVQLTDGRRWFVKLDTGRPVAQPTLGEHTARVNWPHAPAFVGDRLALSDGPGLVRLVQLGGRVKWAYEADNEEGLGRRPATSTSVGRCSSCRSPPELRS